MHNHAEKSTSSGESSCSSQSQATVDPRAQTRSVLGEHLAEQSYSSSFPALFFDPEDALRHHEVRLRQGPEVLQRLAMNAEGHRL